MVSHIALKANSPRSLVVRSLYAQKLLQFHSENYRVLNCDQSWLNQTDFRLRKWNYKRGHNSIPTRPVNPRLSLIATIDTRGEVYLSLSTVNTGSEQICLYLKWLILKLDKEDKNWKKKTVLLLDGAAYHRSKEIHNYLASKGVKVVIGGPYAFSAAPIEY